MQITNQRLKFEGHEIGAKKIKDFCKQKKKTDQLLWRKTKKFKAHPYGWHFVILMPF